ncbi:MAG: tripartite tricarboxylate transporter permease [Candidatus Pacearchaeota archaeon]
MLEFFLATIIGVFAGIITGIIPGIHVNLISAVALTFTFQNPLLVSCFLVAMAITHTFLDFIPSIFLGAPAEDSAMALLPGHRLLLKGFGFYAVKLTLIGSFYGFLVALLIIPLLIIFLPKTWPLIKLSVPLILLIFSLFLILKEKRKALAFIVFLFSGLLGVFTLNFKAISQPLLPLFTGLFGLPLLVLSIKNKTKLVKQHQRELTLKTREKIRPLAAGIVSSSFVSLYPAIGPGQAAIIGSDLLGKLNTKEFLILVGSINTIVMLFSFVNAYLIQKPRSGAAVVVNQILGGINFNQLLLLIIVAFIASCLSVFICLGLTKFICKYINRISYQKLCFLVIVFIISINIIVSHIWSLIVLATGFFIGLIPNLKEMRRVHLMGCLVLPVLGYYF